MTKLYDRLPFEIAQVLAEIVEWRQDQRAGRDECAEGKLKVIGQSVDAMIAWHERQAADTRVMCDETTDMVRRVRQETAARPKPVLRLVTTREGKTTS